MVVIEKGIGGSDAIRKDGCFWKTTAARAGAAFYREHVVVFDKEIPLLLREYKRASRGRAAGRGFRNMAAPPAKLSAGLEQLRTAKIDFEGTHVTLSKVLSNIVGTPTEPKYRKLRTTNEKIRQLLQAPGARQLLVGSGFVEEADFLVLPEAADLGAVQLALDGLRANQAARVAEEAAAKQEAVEQQRARAMAKRRAEEAPIAKVAQAKASHILLNASEENSFDAIEKKLAGWKAILEDAPYHNQEHDVRGILSNWESCLLPAAAATSHRELPAVCSLCASLRSWQRRTPSAQAPHAVAAWDSSHEARWWTSSTPCVSRRRRRPFTGPCARKRAHTSSSSTHASRSRVARARGLSRRLPAEQQRPNTPWCTRCTESRLRCKASLVAGSTRPDTRANVRLPQMTKYLCSHKRRGPQHMTLNHPARQSLTSTDKHRTGLAYTCRERVHIVPYCTYSTEHSI